MNHLLDKRSARRARPEFKSGFTEYLQVKGLGVRLLSKSLSLRVKRCVTEEVTNSTEEKEFNSIEEVVDPETASDELEIGIGFATNFKTQFGNRNPVARYLLKNCGKSTVVGERVVNGADAEDGVYPWAVAILKQGDPWCGGSILNRHWIVTASHCFMS